MREDEATAGASDEREVEELDMELVVNHGRIARIRYAHVMLLIEFRQGAVSVARLDYVALAPPASPAFKRSSKCRHIGYCVLLHLVRDRLVCSGGDAHQPESVGVNVHVKMVGERAPCVSSVWRLGERPWAS